MFLEIKPYQMIKLDDVVGFAMYPGGEYGGKTLYVHMHGVRDGFRFHFETERDCKIAYCRLKDALKECGNKMEDHRDGAYIY